MCLSPCQGIDKNLFMTIDWKGPLLHHGQRMGWGLALAPKPLHCSIPLHSACVHRLPVPISTHPPTLSHLAPHLLGACSVAMTDSATIASSHQGVGLPSTLACASRARARSCGSRPPCASTSRACRQRSKPTGGLSLLVTAAAAGAAVAIITAIAGLSALVSAALEAGTAVMLATLQAPPGRHAVR